MDRHQIMGRRRPIRILSIVMPLAGLAFLYAVRLALLHLWSIVVVDVLIGGLMTAGVLCFSGAIFHIIDRQDRNLVRQNAELERRYATERHLRAQLEALHEATLTMASARMPAEILQRLVDLAHELIGARYAALGVLGPQGAIDDFFTAGISAEERARLGPPPQGRGLLGVVLAEGTALRLADITADPRAAGFPPGHPPMRSLLAVPLAHHGQVLGNLYLTDKIGAAGFSLEDERVLSLLAAHAAVVVAQARLAERLRRLALEAERSRISHDLHDGVIQALYAVTLELECAAEDVDAHPEEARERLDTAIGRLGDVMTDVRRYIGGLEADVSDASLPDALAALLAGTRAQTLLEVGLHVEEAGVHDLPAALAQQFLQIAREAVANVVRHARAGHVWVTLERVAADVHLRVADDGVGFEPHAVAQAGHFGLRNLRERAADMGGTLTVQSTPGRGTTVDVRAPVVQPEREEMRV